MKTTILVLAFFLSLKRSYSQEFFNIYVPLANLSVSNNQSVTPFCLDMNSLRDDNWFWSINADVVLQATAAFFLNFEPSNGGGIIHGRFGYAIFGKPNLKHGPMLDMPFRYPGGVGLGMGYFVHLEISDNKIVLTPQVTFGKFSNNEALALPGNYFSAEVDFAFKISKSTGLSIKPFTFINLFDQGTQTMYGIKIGFCKYNMAPVKMNDN